MDKQTDSVITLFREAFQKHDPRRLAGITSENCVLETPDGARYEGSDACLAFWSEIARDKNIQFDEERVDIIGDRALIFWRLPQSKDHAGVVRGVNILHVSNGKIVEARGYVKGSESARL